LARHRSDTEVNNREAKTVVGKELITKKWKDIKVGAIVQLTNSEFVTVRKYSFRLRILNGWRLAVSERDYTAKNNFRFMKLIQPS